MLHDHGLHALTENPLFAEGFHTRVPSIFLFSRPGLPLQKLDTQIAHDAVLAPIQYSGIG